MRIRGEEWERSGLAVDLRDHGLTPERVLAAVRSEPVERPSDEGESTVVDGQSDERGLTVECGTPGPVHEFVGLVRHGMQFSRRSALAAAARSRGMEPPQAKALAAVESEIAAASPPTVDCREARRQVATVGVTEAELRERVASLQGAIRTRRELGAETDDVERTLRETVQQLTDVETDRVAAEQTLSRARVAALDSWDARQRLLQLQDRRDNLQRKADAWLARRMHDEFETALAAVPGNGDAANDRVDAGTASVPEDPVTAALAIVRVAAVRAPVVLACERFESAEAAASTLAAPVITV
ncbi:hypothetical protein [Haloarchaeobius sp. TZWWS8]|uniref:DUF7856 family protein n=1 Tax=Haloarchaeobius sp. TZWWS8 TaxID=3446121 RepID=UPI003EC0A7A3